MAEMSRCEVLICEAMHGAIVADALRIPWMPVSCYEDISAFKWRDWLSTVELPYAPTQITSLFDAERHMERWHAAEEQGQTITAAGPHVVDPLDRATSASLLARRSGSWLCSNWCRQVKAALS